MTHLRVPDEVSSVDVRAKGCSWSPGLYRQVIIPNRNTRTISELLDERRPFDRGEDPGSVYYVANGPKRLIRTKALQDHSAIVYPKGDAIETLSPRGFSRQGLVAGDILLSKDSNVGECAMLDKRDWSDYMFSGGVVRLHPATDRFYLLAFLKHPIFKAQVLARTPRGATIAHAGSTWLDCLVPFPTGRTSELQILTVSTLMRVWVETESAIRARHETILDAIHTELISNQKGPGFRYSHPTSRDVRRSSRFDTGLYCPAFGHFSHRVAGYSHGSTDLVRLGVKWRRGPNLAVSVIGKSIYSEEEKPAWYELIRPVNIGEYGTLIRQEWLGTPKRLPIVKSGDLILGCEGFEKGRSLLVVDAPRRCTTNFHGTVIFWPGRALWQMAFLHCYFAYLRQQGVLDLVGVGGSGGHMSPEYFEYLPVPCIPDSVQRLIARMYYCPGKSPSHASTPDEYLAAHRRWREMAGIVEMNRVLQDIKAELRRIQDGIIDGNDNRPLEWAA